MTPKDVVFKVVDAVEDPGKRRRRGIDVGRWVSIVVLSGLSFMGTTRGLSAVMTSAGTSEALAWTFAGTFTFAVQWMLVTHIRWAKGSVTRMEAVRHMGAVMLCWLISVTGAYSTFWALINQGRVAEAELDDHTTAVLAYATEFETHFGGVVDQLNQLETHSSAMERIERTQGGTCGEATPPRAGPRSRKRREDQNFFQRQAPLFTAKLREIRKRRKSLQAAIAGSSPESFHETSLLALDTMLYTRSVSLAPDLAALQAALTERVREGREGFETVSGTKFRCPDATLEAIAEAIVSIRLPEPPDHLDTFDPNDTGDALMEGMGRLGGLAVDLGSSLSAWLPQGVDERRRERVALIRNGGFAARKATAEDLAPLVIAIVIDGLILISAPAAVAAISRRRRTSSVVFGNSEFDYDAALEATEKVVSGEFAGETIHRLLRERRISFAGVDLIWVSDPAGTDDAPLSRLLEVLHAEGEAKEIYAHVSTKDLARDLDYPSLAQTAGAGYVRVYQVPRMFIPNLVARARDIEHARLVA